jgi:hypothetical protein
VLVCFPLIFGRKAAVRGGSWAHLGLKFEAGQGLEAKDAVSRVPIMLGQQHTFLKIMFRFVFPFANPTSI